MIQILKKDGVRLENFDADKIIRAVNMASDRACERLEPTDLRIIVDSVFNTIKDLEIIPVSDLHLIVIKAIEKVNSNVAKCYKDYRGYKQNFNKTFSHIIDDTRNLLDNGDKENANKNSEIVSTKKELTSGIISKHIALDYELPKDIATAHKLADIHVHDLTDEIFGGINCCLFDMARVLEDGYRINGVDMTKPNHLETALSTISDIILSASSQQFGNQL